ncbi:thioredoxin [Candidatus Pacearchaeota archaeon]|jgi:thioredoxin 1|nr:thioredoxin [Candidatus Pacearchaeota archaeon]
MASENVPELTNNEFGSFTEKGVVLIDFFADGCMPCMMMVPVIEDLSQRFKGKIKFGKVNVGENADIAQKFGVSSIPNFVILKDGKTVDQFVGAISENELEKKLDNHLG